MRTNVNGEDMEVDQDRGTPTICVTRVALDGFPGRRPVGREASLNISVSRQPGPQLFPRLGSPARRQRRSRDYGLFLSQALRSPSVTASLFPSSRFLASAMLRAINFRTARVVVELGVGTGAITKQILRRLNPKAVLLGVDLNRAFVNHVERTTQDSRFIPILGEAERLDTLLGQHRISHVDAIVSSLGLTGMRESQRSTIMTQAAAYLTRDGVLTQYQYLHANGEPNWVSSLGLMRFREKEFLKAHFRHVASERVIWNLPPATVYTCRV